jgi:TolA-binding protein
MCCRYTAYASSIDEKLASLAPEPALSPSSASASATPLEEEEKELKERLARIQNERSEVSTDLEHLEQEADTLTALEESFWQQHRDFQLELNQLNKEQSALEQKIKVPSHIRKETTQNLFAQGKKKKKKI